MAEIITTIEATQPPAKSNKKAPAKKAPTKPATKAVTVPKKDKKPIKKATDGTLRGVAKPKNWEPAKKMTPFDPKDILTLRKPQVAILRMLAKARAPLSRPKMMEALPSMGAWLYNWIGQPDDAARLDREERWGFTSLVSAKLAKCKEVTVLESTEWGYEITPAGRKAITDYEAALKQKETDKKQAEKDKILREKERAKKAASK